MITGTIRYRGDRVGGYGCSGCSCRCCCDGGDRVGGDSGGGDGSGGGGGGGGDGQANRVPSHCSLNTIISV
ncbi:unnamed protein product [Echinostoma caproni]|uniref:CX domain-containing protein n=1 Tax=Echinostoma caproni TaxID=27848 RepID=A0A183B337_9TREM|nr:unnamed protein product [Echinostoma caproni]